MMTGELIISVGIRNQDRGFSLMTAGSKLNHVKIQCQEKLLTTENIF